MELYYVYIHCIGSIVSEGLTGTCMQVFQEPALTLLIWPTFSIEYIITTFDQLSPSLAKAWSSYKE